MIICFIIVKPQCIIQIVLTHYNLCYYICVFCICLIKDNYENAFLFTLLLNIMKCTICVLKRAFCYEHSLHKMYIHLWLTQHQINVLHSRCHLPVIPFLFKINRVRKGLRSSSTITICYFCQGHSSFFAIRLKNHSTMICQVILYTIDIKEYMRHTI